MSDSLALVERQVAFLERQKDDAAFLVQLDPFLRALEGDPTLAGHLEDMRGELVDVLVVMERIDEELTAELIPLRNEFAQMRPGADDTHTPRPESPRTAAGSEYFGTFAFFDTVTGGDPSPFNAQVEGGKAQTLVTVLSGKDELYGFSIAEDRGTTTELMVGTQEPIGEPVPQFGQGGARRDEAHPEQLERWRQDLGNIKRRLNHAVRWAKLKLRVSGGHALISLEQTRDLINPEPKLLGPGYTLRDHGVDVLNDVLTGKSLFGFVVEGITLEGGSADLLSSRVGELRAGVDRLREELHQRIGTTRSRLAVINRFKLRCEWHDRVRMTAVADDGSLAGGPEDRLTAELARYLFDSGLSPLSKPMTGGLEPDLLDPHARFYVEAKQFMGADRAMIRRGFAQLIDTVNKLRGSPSYQVEEAFYVIFRRDGPYYEVPATVRLGNLDVHMVLIDLAPSQTTGRRQRRSPKAMTAEEFLGAVSPDQED